MVYDGGAAFRPAAVVKNSLGSFATPECHPPATSPGVRAGVLEPGTVGLLLEAKLGDRMVKERLVHDGVALGFAGRGVRVDLRALCGQAVTVYGQTEITKDLIDARVAANAKRILGQPT